MLAYVQTTPPPHPLRKNQEKRRLLIAVVNRVPVHISINNFLLLFHQTVEKALTDQHESGLFKSTYTVILLDILNLYSEARF